jgi:hypothetical protein
LIKDKIGFADQALSRWRHDLHDGRRKKRDRQDLSTLRALRSRHLEASLLAREPNQKHRGFNKQDSHHKRRRSRASGHLPRVFYSKTAWLEIE